MTNFEIQIRLSTNAALWRANNCNGPELVAMSASFLPFRHVDATCCNVFACGFRRISEVVEKNREIEIS